MLSSMGFSLNLTVSSTESRKRLVDRLHYFKRLCPPRISTLDRLLSIKSQTQQEETASGTQGNESPTENSSGNNFQSFSTHASPINTTDKRHTHSKTYGGPKGGTDVTSTENNDESDIESDSASTPGRVSSIDLCDESRSSVSSSTQSKSQSCALESTNFKIHRVSISPWLREVSGRWLKDSTGFCSKICRNPRAVGLASAFLQIYDQQKDAEVLALYRRFQLRNFYLLAVELDYHTGERWCRNASSDLAKQIRKQRLSLEVGQEKLKSHLDKFVRLGRKYSRWATELGGSGYLLAMPLNITERE